MTLNENANYKTNKRGLTEMPELGSIFYSGSSEKKPLEYCLEQANESKHNFVVALDYYCFNNKTKVFGSYKSCEDYWRNVITEMKEHGTQICSYEIITENTKVKLFADLEWPLNWHSVDEVKQKFESLLLEVDSKMNVKQLLYTNASDVITNKGSLHVVHPFVIFENIDDHLRFMNAVYNIISSQNNWHFLDETDKSYMTKTFIDFQVYNKNRQMRLPFSCKMNSKGENKRPLIPSELSDFIETNNGNYKRIIEYCITAVPSELKTMDVSDFPSENNCRKRAVWNKELIKNALEASGIHDVTVACLKNDGRLVQLRNKTKNRVCVINGEDNKSDNAYLTIEDNALYYSCFDEKCKGQKKKIYELRVPDNHLSDNLPLSKHVMLYEKAKQRIMVITFQIKESLEREKEIDREIKRIHRKKKKDEEDKRQWRELEDEMTENLHKREKLEREKQQTMKAWEMTMLDDLNNYMVVITGTAKPYILYRETSRTKMFGKSVNWQDKYFPEFKNAFDNYAIMTCDGKPKRKSLISYWLEWAGRRTYQLQDCYDGEVPDNSFNTWTGLQITRDLAFTKGTQDISYFIKFIKSAWCNDEPERFEYLMNFLASVVQFPCKKLRKSIVLQGNEGTGKGTVVQCMGAIVGKKHFFHPSSPEDLFGSFTYLLDDKVLVFADELIWGGNKDYSGVFKKLISEESRVSNEKFKPQRVVRNLCNWICASNNDWVVPAGSRARRWVVYKVNNLFYSLSPEEKHNLINVCPFSVAKFLYSRDISNWDSNEDIITEGLIEQKIRTMDSVHSWFKSKLDNDDLEAQYCKQDLYDEYARSSGPCKKVAYKSFWLDMAKVAIWKETRVTKNYTNKKVRGIVFATRNELINKFNEVYGCNIINAYEDEQSDRNEIVVVSDEENEIPLPLRL